MSEEKNINDILKDFIDRYQHAKPLRAVVDEVEGGFIFASPSDGSAIVKAFYNVNLVPKVGKRGIYYYVRRRPRIYIPIRRHRRGGNCRRSVRRRSQGCGGCAKAKCIRKRP